LKYFVCKLTHRDIEGEGSGRGREAGILAVAHTHVRTGPPVALPRH